MTEKNIAQHIENNSQLKTLIAKAAAIKKLEKAFQQELSQMLSPSNSISPDSARLIQGIKVCSYDLQTLNILIDNAALATHLRFLLPELCDRLKKHGYFQSLRTIKYKINTESDIQTNPNLNDQQLKPNPMSPENTQILANMLKMVRPTK